MAETRIEDSFNNKLPTLRVAYELEHLTQTDGAAEARLRNAVEASKYLALRFSCLCKAGHTIKLTTGGDKVYNIRSVDAVQSADPFEIAYSNFQGATGQCLTCPLKDATEVIVEYVVKHRPRWYVFFTFKDQVSELDRNGTIEAVSEVLVHTRGDVQVFGDRMDGDYFRAFVDHDDAEKFETWIKTRPEISCSSVNTAEDEAAVL